MSRDKAWPLKYNETIKETFHPNLKILNLYDLLSIMFCKRISLFTLSHAVEERLFHAS